MIGICTSRMGRALLALSAGALILQAGGCAVQDDVLGPLVGTWLTAVSSIFVSQYFNNLFNLESGLGGFSGF